MKKNSFLVGTLAFVQFFAQAQSSDLPKEEQVNRTDIDTVVTEHGIAELRNKSIDERAFALIEVADPAFREQLSADWHELRKTL